MEAFEGAALGHSTKRDPEWDSDSTPFREFENKYISSILRREHWVTNDDGSKRRYNSGSTIVYLLNRDNSKTHGDTLARAENPDMVQSPCHTLETMLLDTKLSDVPGDLVETRHGITDLKTALTKAASATPEITTSEQIAIQTQIGEAQLRLRNAIESELSWIITSPMSSQLLRRQTPLVEPRTIAQFTTGELNLNADR
jgi:hypothetical protein